MTGFPFKTRWLALRLAAYRQGPLSWIGGVLVLLALVAAVLLLPWLEADRERLQQAVVDAADQLRAKTPMSSGERSAMLLARRSTDFFAMLGEAQAFESSLTVFFDAAAEHGLTLTDASYTYPSDADAAFQAVELSFPLSGSYAAIRNFCEQSLLAMPYAALRSIQFKRDGTASDHVLADVRFTLFLAQPSAPGMAAPAQAITAEPAPRSTR